MFNRKYRCWCENKQEWEKHNIFLAEDGNMLHLSDLLNKCVPTNNQTHIIEFYIGKQDKGSNEIFDGDIICIEDYEEDEQTGNYINFIGLVYWDNENLCWSIKNNKDYFPFYDIWDYKIEIIGNIHENKYLLENQNG